MLDSKENRKLTKFNFPAPHTYVIIFFVVILCWLMTFVVPVGKYNVETIEYTAADGSTATREVVVQDSFRYKHPYIAEKLESALTELAANEGKLAELGVDASAVQAVIDSRSFTQEALDAIGLTEETMYNMYGTSLQDTSVRQTEHAGIWGTPNHYGFGVLNYLYEGLVSGNRSSAAIAIVMIILVIGGSFGVVIQTGAINTGMYAFINKVGKYEILLIPGLTFLFGLAGAVFGMQESVIAFAMVVVPITVAMGYDSLVGIGITYVAAMAGNATSWMNPFGVGLAQGIAGVPLLSGAGFRICTWLITMTLTSAYLMHYATRIKKNPTSSLTYETDAYFRGEKQVDISGEKMSPGVVLVLLNSGKDNIVFDFIDRTASVGSAVERPTVEGIIAAVAQSGPV